ncbi:MAG: hypothetical protein ACTSYD_03080 [Candidatus Heimdallarchaeaceae archaeon]
MSLFKTTFMNLIEAFLQDHGYTVKLCNIYTKGVDFYESYKRVILCAYKGDILLCIRARSGDASDPFSGSEEQIEQKLQEPALKLLSAVYALNQGVDPVYCEEFKGMKAIPVIIMEKSTRLHPLYYFYEGETRETKAWYKKKNVVYIPWEWMKNNWSQDFEESLLSQGFEVTVKQKYEPPKKLIEITHNIENIFASRRIGIIKSSYLSQPTLPPLVIRLTQDDTMLIFFIDEEEKNIFSKLMDFAIYYFGTKTTKFPSDIKVLVFNINSEESDNPYVIPYVPETTEFIESHFDHPYIIKTTTSGLGKLIDIAQPNELHALTKLTPLESLELEDLLKVPSGFWFSKVFNEAKKRLQKLYKTGCPFCQNKQIEQKIPINLVSRLKIDTEVESDNFVVFYCSPETRGCGIGVLLLRSLTQGGVHGFYSGKEQFYTLEIESAKKKLKELGLQPASFTVLE